MTVLQSTCLYICTCSPTFYQYPSSPPSISIHNPRGLSDDMLSRYSHTLPGACLVLQSAQETYLV